MAYGATFTGPMLSLASCEIRVAGVQIVGLTKADMECGMKADPEYGSGPIALGSAIGVHEATFSMDQHLQEAMVLQKLLNASSGGAGYAFAEVNVSFTFTGAGIRVSGLVVPVRSILIEGVRFLKCKPAPSNDGKSIIASWTTLVTRPIAWSLATGETVYSVNPDLFAGSNSLAVGVGGEVLASG